MKTITTHQPIVRDLGDGLILRRSSPADAQALADFCGRIHSDDGWDKPDEHIAVWTRDLLTKPHPTFHSDDFTVVEEAATGRIVSTLNLISQTWNYEGIPFGVGRPELVGTLPEFRNRGLIRCQFEEIHRWSVARGEMVQAITGIPFYYRLFGYEMTLNLSGRRAGFESHIPRLKEGEPEPYLIREAREDDLPFVAELYAESQKRYAISCQRGLEVFKYELNVQDKRNADHYPLQIIESQDGQRIGYFHLLNRLDKTTILCVTYELKDGISWLEVSPSVVRRVWEIGQEYAKQENTACNSFAFLLGESHPVYDTLGDALPAMRDPYAWYLRVADLPGFIRHIAPALEKRLNESLAVGYSGELKLNFYRDGLRLVFERGRLTCVESWKPQADEKHSAAFPGLTFLQIVFGYRSLTELEQSFPDCYWNNNEARVVLNAIFPKRLSDVYAIA